MAELTPTEVQRAEENIRIICGLQPYYDMPPPRLSPAVHLGLRGRLKIKPSPEECNFTFESPHAPISSSILSLVPPLSDAMVRCEKGLYREAINLLNLLIKSDGDSLSNEARDGVAYMGAWCLLQLEVFRDSV